MSASASNEPPQIAPPVMRKLRGNADDELTEVTLRLRHAAFALAAAVSSVEEADRAMADSHLKEAARQYVAAEKRAGK